MSVLVQNLIIFYGLCPPSPSENFLPRRRDLVGMGGPTWTVTTKMTDRWFVGGSKNPKPTFPTGDLGKGATPNIYIYIYNIYIYMIHSFKNYLPITTSVLPLAIRKIRNTMPLKKPHQRWYPKELVVSTKLNKMSQIWILPPIIQIGKRKHSKKSRNEPSTQHEIWDSK